MDQKLVRMVKSRQSVIVGFTLIEMLAVIALISIFAGVIGVALRDKGTDTFGLQTAQATIVSVFTLARAEAVMRGQTAAVMVCADISDSERYLRYLVPAIQDSSTSEWSAISSGAYLPQGTFIVPYGGPDAGAVEDGTNWDGTEPVASTWLREDDTIVLKGLATTSSRWIWMTLDPRGSTSRQGDIVLATGRPNPPGSPFPFVFTNPENVRGITVRLYGHFTLLNNRKDL